jgi:hypothetical protein
MIAMRNWIYFFTLSLLVSCKSENVTIYFTPEKAKQYFKEVETICNNDGGKLWGKNLYGPVMYIDRPTRKIFANQPDKNGLLKEKDGIYTGVYPKELIIDNISLTYGSTMFAMAPLPPEEDSYRIKNRAIHGLFHCFQKTQGINPSGFYIKHMDEKNARMWLKLEWRALRNAINNIGEQRSQAIRDALIFRGARRELYSKNLNEENKFENYEGLATFTYSILCTNSKDEFKTRLLEYLDRIYTFQSYARTYGFINGGLYAFLLSEKGFDFKTIKTDSTDISQTVRKLYDIQLPEICRDVAGSLALSYDIESIYREEDQRLADIKERIHRQISTFTEKPVVFFELESPYFDFEPEDIRSLDTLGTLYIAMRVSDNWGKLTVDNGGCLVSNNFKYLRITAKGFKESKNHIYGEGWHLILNDDWELVKMGQNYFVRNLMP